MVKTGKTPNIRSKLVLMDQVLYEVRMLNYSYLANHLADTICIDYAISQ